MKKENGFLLIGILITVVILMLLAGGFLAFKEDGLFSFDEKLPSEVEKELEKLPLDLKSDVQKLQDCLKEVKKTRAEICKEMDLGSNCVGVDFTKDPSEECYLKYAE